MECRVHNPPLAFAPLPLTHSAELDYTADKVLKFVTSANLVEIPSGLRYNLTRSQGIFGKIRDNPVTPLGLCDFEVLRDIWR